MIRREILEYPEEVLDSFDWFNDYDDTKLWLSNFDRPDLVERLDKGFKKWQKEWQLKFRERAKSCG